MKYISLITAVISGFWWGAILVANVAHLDLLACVMLPEDSIGGVIWFQVVFPTAMVTASAVAFILNILANPPSKWSLCLPFVTFASLLIYFVFVTGLSITQAAIDACTP